MNTLFNMAVKNFDNEISEGKNAEALINIADIIDNAAIITL